MKRLPSYTPKSEIRLNVSLLLLKAKTLLKCLVEIHISQHSPNVANKAKYPQKKLKC